MSPHVRASRGLLSSLARPSLSASTSRTSTFLPSSQTPASIRLAHGDVPSSAARRAILRRRMEEWLSGPGQVFREPSPYGTNYLTNYSIDGAPIKKDPAQDEAAEGEKAVSADSDATINSLRPFPLNPSFVSQPVLSEELRNQIYKEVVENKKGVRAVSVMYGVDMRRVGAVVRLVELEKRWVQAGKPLAKPYARAVHRMIPTTPLRKDNQPQHETINDLPVHPLTGPQLFYPVSESRRFTRADAGRVFSAAPAQIWNSERAKEPHNSPAAIERVTRDHRTIEKVGKTGKEDAILLPADVRIPHPHLVAHQYESAHNDDGNVNKLARNFFKRMEAEDKAEKERKERRTAAEEERTTHIVPENGRFEFRFKDVSFDRETIGVNGRGKGPAARYGVPSEVRKKGTVQIPRKVDA